MTQNSELNNYLTRLEKSLGQISVSDRAEIVLEIKSHIDEAMASGGEIHNVLASLGEPETVANRYLLERGLPTQKTPKHPIVKWLTIGFLGTFAIASIMLLIVLWSFSPLIHVDEAQGRVKILGGLIDIHEKAGNMKFGNVSANDKWGTKLIEGSMLLESATLVDLKFSNVKADLATSADRSVHWSCKVDDSLGSEIKPEYDGKSFVFDFRNIKGAKCDFRIPQKIMTRLQGDNGRLDVDHPAFSLDVELGNGAVEFDLQKTSQYKFDFYVGNGRSPQKLLSSESPDAIVLKAKVGNGRIEVDGL